MVCPGWLVEPVLRAGSTRLQVPGWSPAACRRKQQQGLCSFASTYIGTSMFQIELVFSRVSQLLQPGLSAPKQVLPDTPCVPLFCPSVSASGGKSGQATITSPITKRCSVYGDVCSVLTRQLADQRSSNHVEAKLPTYSPATVSITFDMYQQHISRSRAHIEQWLLGKQFCCSSCNCQQ